MFPLILKKLLSYIVKHVDETKLLLESPPHFIEKDTDDEEGEDAEHGGHVDPDVVVKASPAETS